MVSNLGRNIEKGFNKVREEGIKEGIKEEKINIAKNLLLIGMDLENISKATGLSIEEIESLKA